MSSASVSSVASSSAASVCGSDDDHSSQPSDERSGSLSSTAVEWSGTAPAAAQQDNQTPQPLTPPWQLEWKRPQWQSVGVTDANKREHGTAGGAVVSHALAQVLHSEVGLLLEEEEEEEDKKNGSNKGPMASPVAAPSSKEPSLFLSVTLLSTRRGCTAGDPASTQSQQHSVADSVLLEVMRQDPCVDQEKAAEAEEDWLSSTYHMVQSRQLQWPQSVWEPDLPDAQAAAHPQKERRDTPEPSWLEQVLPIGSNLSSCDPKRQQGEDAPEDEKEAAVTQPKEDAETSSPKQRKDTSPFRHGLVACVLYRVPWERQGHHRQQETVQVLQWLSLQPEQHEQQQPSASESVEGTSSQATTTTLEQESEKSSQLLLALLSSDGQIHVYRPDQLLASSSSSATASATTLSAEQQRQQQNQHDDLMASSLFFLGPELVPVLEQSLQPLSQPLHTVPVPVPLWKSHRTRKGHKSHSKSKAHDRQSHRRRRRRRADSNQLLFPLPLWLSSLATWDPLFLDAASVQYRTTENRATLLTACMDYLVVAGSGRRERRRSAAQGRRNRERSGGGQKRGGPVPTSASWPLPRQYRTALDQQQEKKEKYHGLEFEEKNQGISRSSSSSTTSNDNKRWWRGQQWQERSDDDDVASAPVLLRDEKGDIFLDQEKLDLSAPRTTGDSTSLSSKIATMDDITEEEEEEDDRVQSLSDADDDDGGFVTFISLYTHAVERTVFLPFVPVQISPIHRWNCMSLIVVLGELQAVAIRVDSDPTVILTGAPLVDGRVDSVLPPTTAWDPFSASRRQNNESQTIPKEAVRVRRFQLLPIRWPDIADIDTDNVDGRQAFVSNPLMVASNWSTSPPTLVFLHANSNGEVYSSGKASTNSQRVRILQRSLTGLQLVASSEGMDPVWASYCPREDRLAVVRAEHAPGRQQVADISVLADTSSSAEDVWCSVGQGWCLVGSGTHVFFVCWEGSVGSSRREPFVLKLATSEVAGLSDAHRSQVADALPLDPWVGERGGSAVVTPDLPLPFTKPYEMPSILGREGSAKQGDSTVIAASTSESSLDDVVIDAIESISSLNYRATVANLSSPMSPRRRITSFTNREKSERLLRKCSSWTQLEEGEGKLRFELQQPVVGVRFGDTSTTGFLLSLRKLVVDNGAATPFQQVLAWLSERRDYFTAASLALDLLRDAESLRHLWKAFDKIDDDEERSKLDGLLDGVIPIGGDRENEEKLHSTLTQLADMTVGCLTKGGFAMSATLEYFVGKDTYYDPARACLMLVATTARAVSDDEDTVTSVMGDGYRMEDMYNDDILWPTRCLLRVGITRDYLFTALVLLNAAIPDELRHRRRSGLPTATLPSLYLCKSLIKVIVACSPEAADILLSLTDELARVPFWQSLDHETRLELSLISIDSKSPLLRQPEIRSWALTELNKCMETERSATIVESMPTEWLKQMSMSTVMNAGCELNNLVAAVGQTSEEADVDGIRQHREMLKAARQLLIPASGSGGLDFDLLIPALLILDHRGVLWHEESRFSTQAILNAGCFLAGHRNIEEPLFAMDGATLMRQCTLAGNIQAGANLIGGRDGLILECCDILIDETGLSMEAAESFLLSDPMSAPLAPKFKGGAFSIQYGHRHILWLLQEHVLEIRTYGEFDTTHLRGKVDPVFAATTCLRSWWMISCHNITDASVWLVAWLRAQLEIDGGTSKSPHRLACAALTRALIWPTKPNETVLASYLEIPSHFLVQLSLSCCGLVEAVPPGLAVETWSTNETKRDESASFASQVADLSADSVEESFMTAATEFS